MRRPDVAKILSPLEAFQRRTVDHAFERLFLAPDSTARFLVADEVGLGKTLVARGIIARTIEHLWDTVGRIDIVYICSNESIARANLPKLQVSTAEQKSFALATRLTMLATELAADGEHAGLAKSKLNFVSFTPGTSFGMGFATGKSREREILFHLLAPVLDATTALMNILQGNVTRTKSWRRRLAREEPTIEPTIRRRFVSAFSKRRDLRQQFEVLRDRWFHYHRPTWPSDAKAARNRFIGELRKLLAAICVGALEPDLVILDEFQRFKNLLASPRAGAAADPAAELAQTLFRTVTPEGHPVRTLLLSATPYKLYTSDVEIDAEDHYEDFLATTRFLMDDDESRVGELKRRLAGFGRALRRATRGDSSDVLAAKGAVESMLRKVMARTERVDASEERDAMLHEHRHEAEILPADIHQYLATDALFRAVGDRDPMPFWKSAPYLVHFMHGYRVNERLDDSIALDPEKINEVLARHPRSFLSVKALEKWDAVPAAHAKLRGLEARVLDGGLWKCLWMPPTVHYWPARGPFAGIEGATKTLLFSAWNVVPDVIAAYLSYEADRRMCAGRLEDYRDPARQQRPLLRLTRAESGVRSRHRLLLLLLPCLTLADEAHPLTAPSGTDREAWVRRRIEGLLDQLPDPQEGRIDERWEWAAPLLLDPHMGDFLSVWRRDDDLPRPNRKVLGAYLRDLMRLDVNTLGRRPPGLVDLLLDVALGSPAVLAARTFASLHASPRARRETAVRVADAFWRLFNRPTVISLLASLSGKTGSSPVDDAYWRLVLRYCRDGNLQAVLDEEVHRLRDQAAWATTATADDIAFSVSTELVAVVEPHRSRVHARFLRPARNGRAVREDALRIRTDFALRFGGAKRDEDALNQDGIRASFNSAFRPFVLASTSIGQEGLDFHPWCHALVHWNLPGNPVDLEQREGRVHRYKGHAVRRNVARRHATRALERWCPGDDLWSLLFEEARAQARAAGASDLVPFWLAPGPHRVERHVPLLPYTREISAFDRLKRQLVAYRVVFGQPRQEEFLTLLDTAAIPPSHLATWSIDLAPPPGNIHH